MSFTRLADEPEWFRFNAYRSSVRAPGGELMIEAQSRMVGAIEELRAAHAGEAIIIVSHGDPLRAAIAHYLGTPLDLLQRFEISPASISVLQMHDAGPRLLCINQTGTIPL
jgi:broad specificity phosphatase PhoE